LAAVARRILPGVALIANPGIAHARASRRSRWRRQLHYKLGLRAGAVPIALVARRGRSR